MLNDLRKKFIFITMTSVLAVLIVIVAAVNVVNIRQSNRSADGITGMLLENDGKFHKDMTPIDKNRPGMAHERFDIPQDDFDDRFHNKYELPFSTRFFTITLDESSNIVSYDLESIASVTADDIDSIAKKILSKKNTVGWYKSYRYRVGNTEYGRMIIVMEATNVRSSVLSVLAITVIVALAAFLIVFVLVALFSGRAIRPISETYQKQKQFITDASHELKTPLTVISADVEVLSMTYGENEWTDGIIRQTEHMRSLINKMIQMSKLDEGTITPVFENFDLGDAVYDTAMAFKGIAASKSVEIETDIARDTMFCGDEASIRQLASILMDNAVKYCDEGSTIWVSLKKIKGIGREKVQLSVKNSYFGAGSLDTDKLFERFYRADKARSSTSSFGLGLPIARSIAAMHSGSINAKSNQDGVIEFIVTLPKNS